MLRLSLQDLALRIKIMQIGTSIEDVLLQALDPPSTVNVQRAIASLVEVIGTLLALILIGSLTNCLTSRSKH
jgi:HrpA-like RNA helicase